MDSKFDITIRRDHFWNFMQANHCRKKRLPVWNASEFLMLEMKCDMNETISTMTKMDCASRSVQSKPNTKFMERSSQMPFGTSRGVYRHVFCDCPFETRGT